MKKKEVSSYEGLQRQVRALALPEIEVWENQYSDRQYEVALDIPEFTCICPKTGLPDFAVVKILYSPDKVCLELKSLKLYFVAYREIGIFHEHLVNKILEDIVRAANPRWAKVEALMNPRGGITTSVRAEYRKEARSKK